MYETISYLVYVIGIRELSLHMSSHFRLAKILLYERVWVQNVGPENHCWSFEKDPFPSTAQLKVDCILWIVYVINRSLMKASLFENILNPVIQSSLTALWTSLLQHLLQGVSGLCISH